MDLLSNDSDEELLKGCPLVLGQGLPGKEIDELRIAAGLKKTKNFSHPE